MITRWRFVDPVLSTSYTFENNPSKMSSPLRDKNIGFTATTAPDGQNIVAEGQPVPKEWTFQGVVRSQAFYDALVLWFAKGYRIQVVDHFSRTWDFVFTKLDVQPKNAIDVPWKHDYQVTGLIVGGPS